MAFRSDIVVYDAERQLTLVVEVKSRRGTNDAWAAQTRLDVLGHGLLAEVPYFLLALPDHFYLWVDRRQPEIISPDYSIDPTSLLSPFWGGGDVPEYLSEITFEMILKGWLATVTWVDELPAAIAEEHVWLIKSGLFDAIKHGHLAAEAAL